MYTHVLRKFLEKVLTSGWGCGTMALPVREGRKPTEPEANKKVLDKLQGL